MDIRGALPSLPWLTQAGLKIFMAENQDRWENFLREHAREKNRSSLVGNSDRWYQGK